MLKQKQIKHLTYPDLTSLTASTLTSPEVCYVESENAFYTKISGVNTKVNPPITAASNITYTPTGNVSSTNVQAAITELDNEKVPVNLYSQKGVVLAGSGVSTIGAVVSTTNGQILTVDTTEPTGVKWATPSSTITYDAGNGALVTATSIGVTFVRNSPGEWTFTIPAGVTLLSHSIYSTSSQNPGANVTINYNYTTNTATNQGFTTANPPSYTVFNMQTGVYTQSVTGGNAASAFRPAISSVNGGNITMLCQMGTAVGTNECLIKGNF